ncbi:MAG: MFS transporter, partial [Neisseria sp.]|nr:MFS transporter [Neisseria sp.]
MMNALSRLNHIPIHRFHYKLLLLIGLGWLFDAMDTGLISFIMTELAKDWALTAPQKASIISITFIGMAIGGVWAGKMADRFGRKTVFIATLIIYSLATGL